MSFTKLAVLCVFLMSQFAFAGEGHHGPVPMPKEFELLKKLVGKWEGKSKMGEKEETVTVEYALTSNGTAITELMGKGTPHEMISVYHKDGKSLAMTHYCAVGNQPKMQFKKADANSIAFELKKPIGISSMKEDHMHGVKLTLADNDTLQQEWANYVKGKPAGTMVFNFKRD